MPVLFDGALLEFLAHKPKSTHSVMINIAPASIVIAKIALGAGAMFH